MAQIQWFPGHMAKARREITEKLHLVDIVFEIVDARIPFSSSNPMMREIVKSKPRLVLLNKAKLADPKITKYWMEYYQAQGCYTLDIDLIENYNLNKIMTVCTEALKDKIDRDLSRGLKAAKIRAMVIGIPNVGKSTFINTLCKRKSLIVGDRPGVTKGQTWMKVNDSLELLDTPGILWPKFDTKNIALNLALSGAIKDDILPIDEVITYGLEFMKKFYPANLSKAYNIEIDDNLEVLEVYDLIGRKRGCIMRGNEIDYERVVKLILHDLRHNKLGVLSYDRDEEYLQV
ncbi:MAG: ribosome biogenesis GTPase YlqF [bacterium]